jgi:hypothetical protein
VSPHPPTGDRDAARPAWTAPELTTLPTAATAAQIDPSFFLDVLAAS